MLQLLRDLFLGWVFTKLGLRGCLSCGCLAIMLAGLFVFILVNAVLN